MSKHLLVMTGRNIYQNAAHWWAVICRNQLKITTLILKKEEAIIKKEETQIDKIFNVKTDKHFMV